MTSPFKKADESKSSASSLSTIYIDENSCLLICKFSDYKEINFNLAFGDLKVKLLFGNLNVNEYDLEENKLIELYANKDNHLYFRINFDSKFNLTSFKNWLVKQQFNKHVLKEIHQLKFSSNQSCYMVLYAEKNQDPLHLKYSYLVGKNVQSEWIKLEQRDQILLNDEWKDFLMNNLENQLQCDSSSENRNPINSNKIKKTAKIVMVCGGKNTGKSTLIRYLINRQLSKDSLNKQSKRKIYYLDLDPGQSEFTNSGQLSLVQVNKPCLFPTSINVNKFKSQVVLSCSVCSTNVEDLGSLYSENLANLWLKVEQILKDDDLVFVNTMGFVRIIGFMMLVDAIKLIRPTHLIEIKINLPRLSTQKIFYDINYSTDLNAKSIQSIKGWLCFDANNLSLSYKYLQLSREYNVNFYIKHSKMKRIDSQLVYLSCIDNLMERPLNYLEPFVIKFKDVKIHLAIENQPEDHLVLDILNCSWIQLCKLEESENSNSESNKQANNFELIKRFGPNECLGNGFIRNIDIKNGLFYILTPESASTIRKVNCLVKPNSINAPKEIFIPQLVYSKVQPMYIDVKF